MDGKGHGFGGSIDRAADSLINETTHRYRRRAAMHKERAAADMGEEIEEEEEEEEEDWDGEGHEEYAEEDEEEDDWNKIRAGPMSLLRVRVCVCCPCVESHMLTDGTVLSCEGNVDSSPSPPYVFRTKTRPINSKSASTRAASGGSSASSSSSAIPTTPSGMWVSPPFCCRLACFVPCYPVSITLC